MSPIFHFMQNAPKPVAPYSHAVEVDGFVFVTGQLATDPDDDARPVPEGIEAQTRKVMDNLGRVLKGVGLDFRSVITRAHIPDRIRAGLCDDECHLRLILRPRIGCPPARPSA